MLLPADRLDALSARGQPVCRSARQSACVEADAASLGVVSPLSDPEGVPPCAPVVEEADSLGVAPVDFFGATGSVLGPKPVK